MKKEYKKILSIISLAATLALNGCGNSNISKNENKIESEYEDDCQENHLDKNNLKIETLSDESKNPTVTGILDRLEKKGFIIRKISDRDRRMRIVTLTNSAKKINNEAIECINIFMKKAYKGVTKEEKDNFINMVNKVSYNLENID